MAKMKKMQKRLCALFLMTFLIQIMKHYEANLVNAQWKLGD